MISKFSFTALSKLKADTAYLLAQDFLTKSLPNICSKRESADVQFFQRVLNDLKKTKPSYDMAPPPLPSENSTGDATEQNKTCSTAPSFPANLGKIAMSAIPLGLCILYGRSLSWNF
jgi:hypothetical protein